MDDPTTTGTTEGFGLMFYNARMYDPVIGRFTSADSIVSGGVQAYDRYAYVNNNPVRFTDPTGHRCAPEDDCAGGSNYSALDILKGLIERDFGVTLKDGGAEHQHFVDNKGHPTSHGRTWDVANALLVYQGLSKMNDVLNGKLKTIIGSAAFTMNSHPETGHYFGFTTYQNGANTVDFYTNTTIPVQNLYHEFGHVLNNSAGDAFVKALKASVHESDSGEYWFGGDNDGYLDPQELLLDSTASDPYWSGIDALQHNDGTGNEQWADLWANYAAGNIDQTKGAGGQAYDWIASQLNPYIATP